MPAAWGGGGVRGLKRWTVASEPWGPPVQRPGVRGAWHTLGAGGRHVV